MIDVTGWRCFSLLDKPPSVEVPSVDVGDGADEGEGDRSSLLPISSRSCDISIGTTG